MLKDKFAKGNQTIKITRDWTMENTPTCLHIIRELSFGRNASDTDKSMQALQVECQSLQSHPHFSHAVFTVSDTMSRVVFP